MKRGSVTLWLSFVLAGVAGGITARLLRHLGDVMAIGAGIVVGLLFFLFCGFTITKLGG